MTEPTLEEALERAVRSGTLADLEALLARAQREPDLTADAHAQLVLRLTTALTERDLEDPDRQAELAERYLLEALEHDGDLTPDREAELLDRLGALADRPREGESPARWSARRRRLGRAWLRAMDRHVAALREGTGPGDVPRASVEPPAETGLPGGVAPEHVEDPQLRAQYEADIERNAQHAERYRRRHRRRLLARSTLERGERRLVDAYAAPPPALDELAEDLEHLLSDGETRRRILAEVRARTAGG